jgi:hypothetical protein
MGAHFIGRSMRNEGAAFPTGAPTNAIYGFLDADQMRPAQEIARQ